MQTPFFTNTPINKSLVMATAPFLNKKVIYSTGVRQWYAGQVVDLTAAVELSTYYAAHYTAGKFFCFGVNNEDANGAYLNGEVNGNVINSPTVNPASQNHQMIDSRIYHRFTADYYGCINFCVYAYTSAANGEIVTIGDPSGGSALNYGSMKGTIHDAADCRPVEVYSYSPGPLNGTLLNENLNFIGTWGNNTVRQIIPLSKMVIPPNAVTKFRVTLKAATSGMTLPKVYIGFKSGACGFSAAAQVLFNGGTTAVVPPNGTLTSDFVTLAGWNKATDLVVAIDTGVSNSNEAYGAGAAYSYYIKSPTGDAGNLAPTGYTLGTGYIMAISKIETDGF